MQAVKQEEIRQLFPRSELGNPIEIKSLACIGQLLNAMTDVGASILSHGEFVRLAIHRKLLYLENHDDYNFLNKLVDRSKPELLKLPFTIMGKGGRPHPLQVKQMLLQFGQFLPKETTLHIFILVDSDLRSRYILDKEEKEYKKIQADLYDPKNPKKQTIKVQLYYHCWAAREWENWLLSNENLLYKMICDDEIYHKDEAIKRIRDRIQQHQSMESIFPTSDSFQHDQPMITTTGGASNAPQYPICKRRFENWLKDELKRHFQILLNKLTVSAMEGIENTSGNEEKDLQHKACVAFLTDNGINDDIMNKFGHLRERIEQYIGRQVRYENEEYKEEQNGKKRQQKANARETGEEKKRRLETDTRKTNKVKECRDKWLTDRKLPKTIETTEVLNETIRKELTKWIDAKLFFHELAHGEDNTAQNKGLDSYWRQVFAMGESENNTYKRYFNSIDPQKPDEWPRDFNNLLEKFREFIQAP
ncbi:unnamed protein product [Rotaria sordida]|uniref:Uncharacterized protein n=2 Tax=Rotaria sordida TaxID=392033 RepID=A0A819WGA7_9BILA|nr:unnamed protein product [Rotaria sordida]CAF4124245.1 unnamed protein product [Rotaria sordida]